jgi:hypothetical protein
LAIRCRKEKDRSYDAHFLGLGKSQVFLICANGFMKTTAESKVPTLAQLARMGHGKGQFQSPDHPPYSRLIWYPNFVAT